MRYIKIFEDFDKPSKSSVAWNRGYDVPTIKAFFEGLNPCFNIIGLNFKCVKNNGPFTYKANVTCNLMNSKIMNELIKAVFSQKIKLEKGNIFKFSFKSQFVSIKKENKSEVFSYLIAKTGYETSVLEELYKQIYDIEYVTVYYEPTKIKIDKLFKEKVKKAIILLKYDTDIPVTPIKNALIASGVNKDVLDDAASYMMCNSAWDKERVESYIDKVSKHIHETKIYNGTYENDTIQYIIVNCIEEYKTNGTFNEEFVYKTIGKALSELNDYSLIGHVSKFPIWKNIEPFVQGSTQATKMGEMGF